MDKDDQDDQNEQDAQDDLEMKSNLHQPQQQQLQLPDTTTAQRRHQNR